MNLIVSIALLCGINIGETPQASFRKKDCQKKMIECLAMHKKLGLSANTRIDEEQALLKCFSDIP